MLTINITRSNNQTHTIHLKRKSEKINNSTTDLNECNHLEDEITCLLFELKEEKKTITKKLRI